MLDGSIELCKITQHQVFPAQAVLNFGLVRGCCLRRIAEDLKGAPG